MEVFGRCAAEYSPEYAPCNPYQALALAHLYDVKDREHYWLWPGGRPDQVKQAAMKQVGRVCGDLTMQRLSHVHHTFSSRAYMGVCVRHSASLVGSIPCPFRVHSVSIPCIHIVRCTLPGSMQGPCKSTKRHDDLLIVTTLHLDHPMHASHGMRRN